MVSQQNLQLQTTVIDPADVHLTKMYLNSQDDCQTLQKDINHDHLANWCVKLVFYSLKQSYDFGV